ncbi:MAG: ArsR family transcriptional regulator [Euryarchaeota archaeon]|nr:ArsR family transcriptional regulator [Euryarchaeota archaeon]MDE1837952.1 ArsR family transcriptional regulator [Euryarchaeota archaeon]
MDPSGSGLQDEVVRLRSEVDKLTGLYRDLLGRLATFATMEESYLRLVALYARYGVISPELLVPEAKDPIAREVIRVLAMISEGSVQQITERLREARGSSSRRIVRARLGELQHLGAVEIRSSPKGRVTWRLSDEVVRKWSRMLGLAK